MSFGTAPTPGNLLIFVAGGRVYSGSPPYSGTPTMNAGTFAEIGSDANTFFTVWSMIAPAGIGPDITLPTIEGSFNAVVFFCVEVENQGSWGASIGPSTCDSSGTTIAPTVDAGNGAFMLAFFTNYLAGSLGGIQNPTPGTTVGGYREADTATYFGMGFIGGDVAGAVVPQVQFLHYNTGTFSFAVLLLGYMPKPTYCWVRQKAFPAITAVTELYIDPP